MPFKSSTTRRAPVRAAGRRAARGATRILCAAIISGATLILLAAGSAYAGEWVQVSCINPNQTAAGSAGWASFTAGGGYGSNNSSGCGPSSPAFAILSSDAAVGVGSHETLQYTPPAGSTLTGGALDIGMYADGHGYNASGTAVAYTPEYAYDASNVFFQCAAGLTPCSGFSNEYLGQLDSPRDAAATCTSKPAAAATPAPAATKAQATAPGHRSTCGGPTCGSPTTRHPPPAAWAARCLTPTRAAAGNSRSPPATPPDRASHNLTVQADGQTLYSATPDSNNGRCAAVGLDAGALMFDASQPCKQNENVDIPVETTSLHDGQHTLKVTVTDAAGNSSVVYDNTITTRNAPENAGAPTIATPAQPLPGSALTAQPGQWSAPAGTGATSYSYQWQDCNTEAGNCEAIAGAEGASYTATSADIGHRLRALITATDSDGFTAAASAASAAVASPPAAASTSSVTTATATVTPTGTGALTAGALLGSPNGAAASTVAQLRLAGHTAISRSFPARAFTITGQLTNAAGAPITGASLQVREQTQGASTLQVIAHANTTANGSFTVHVPAGPSRLILIDYRAYSSEVGYSAQAAIEETVSASVQIRVTPRRTSSHREDPHQRTGTRADPKPRRPRRLLVHYHGVWEPLRTPRTNANGRFQVTYQFQGAIGRFPFRAEVFGGQVGYPYTRGESKTVDVSTD